MALGTLNNFALSIASAPPTPGSTMSVTDFDDVLEHVGGYNAYQRRLILLALPFNLVLASIYFGHSFIALVPRHWCSLPELEATLNISVETPGYVGEEGGYPAWAVPLDVMDGNIVRPSQCRQYAINFTQILEDDLYLKSNQTSWPTERCRSGWRYDLHRDYATIVSELNWVCDDSWKPNLAQSVFFLGAVLGSVLLGWLGDQKGRLPVLVISNTIALTAGIATAFTYDFTSFVAARFCLGLTYNNSYMMMYIIMLEYVSPAKRSVVANLPVALFLTFGLITLPWLAFFLWDWRLFCIISSLPMAIGLVAPWLVPESGRWLLAQGRVTEAETILRKCAAVNKRPVDEKVFVEFRAYSKQFAEAERTQQHTFLELFATPVLRKRVILLTALWMSMSLSYDGHVRNLGNLEQYSLYVTFSLTGLLELPADVLTIVTLDSLGRRWTNCSTLFFSALFSALAALMQSSPLIVVILAGCGRFCITMAMNTGMQYCVELLPTQLRGQGVNVVHIAGHLSTFGGPLIVYLGTFSGVLPFTLLCIFSLLGGLISLLLPETAHQTLPETALESENFGLDQPCLSMPCLDARKRKLSHTKRESVVSPDLGSPDSGVTNKSFSNDGEEDNIEISLSPQGIVIVPTGTELSSQTTEKKSSGTIIQSVTSL